MILFSALTLALLLWFTNRHFGMKCALIAGLLHILCPVTFVQFSLAALTGHTESLLLSIAMLVCFYEFMYEKKYRLLFLMLFGITAGFGFWVYHETALMFLACLGAWFFLERKTFLSRNLLVLGLFFLAGLTPWIVYNITHSFKGISFLVHAFIEPQEPFRPLSILKKAFDLFVLKFPLSYYPLFLTHGSFFSLVYYVLFLLTGGWIVLRETGKVLMKTGGNAKVLPFLLYPWIFIFVLLISHFDFNPMPNFCGIRYLAPFHFFGFILSAFALKETSLKRNKVLIGLFLIWGGINQNAVLFQEPFGRALHYKGYSYFSLGMRKYQLPRAPKTYSECLFLALRFKKIDRRYFYAGLMADPGFEGLDLDKQLQEMPPTFRPYLLREAGRNLARDETKHLDDAERLTAGFSLEAKRLFYKSWFSIDSQRFLRNYHKLHRTDFRPRRSLYLALGTHLAQSDTALDREFWEAVKSLNPEFKSWVYRGLGQQVMLDVAYFDPEIMDDYLDSINFALTPKDEIDVFWGIGWILRSSTQEDPVRAKDRILRLPQKFQKAALEGYNAFEQWHDPEPLKWGTVAI